MAIVHTFPTEQELKDQYEITPENMWPNNIPYVAVIEGILSSELCDQIILDMYKIEPYKFNKCGAVTREMEYPLSDKLVLITDVAKGMNNKYWNYHIDWLSCVAWMQSYNAGSEYRMHMDGIAAQTRKLTAIALLSDPQAFEGGDLNFYVPVEYFTPPKTQGSIIVFPHWILHEVEKVTAGVRHTINLGIWGPPFV